MAWFGGSHARYEPSASMRKYLPLDSPGKRFTDITDLNRIDSKLDDRFSDTENHRSTYASPIKTRYASPDQLNRSLAPLRNRRTLNNDVSQLYSGGISASMLEAIDQAVESRVERALAPFANTVSIIERQHDKLSNAIAQLKNDYLMGKFRGRSPSPTRTHPPFAADEAEEAGFQSDSSLSKGRYNRYRRDGSLSPETRLTDSRNQGTALFQRCSDMIQQSTAHFSHELKNTSRKFSQLQDTIDVLEPRLYNLEKQVESLHSTSRSPTKHPELDRLSRDVESLQHQLNNAMDDLRARRRDTLGDDHIKESARVPVGYSMETSFQSLQPSNTANSFAVLTEQQTLRHSVVDLRDRVQRAEMRLVHAEKFAAGVQMILDRHQSQLEHLDVMERQNASLPYSNSDGQSMANLLHSSSLLVDQSDVFSEGKTSELHSLHELTKQFRAFTEYVKRDRKERLEAQKEMGAAIISGLQQERITRAKKLKELEQRLSIGVPIGIQNTSSSTHHALQPESNLLMLQRFLGIDVLQHGGLNDSGDGNNIHNIHGNRSPSGKKLWLLEPKSELGFHWLDRLSKMHDQTDSTQAIVQMRQTLRCLSDEGGLVRVICALVASLNELGTAFCHTTDLTTTSLAEPKEFPELHISFEQAIARLSKENNHSFSRMDTKLQQIESTIAAILSVVREQHALSSSAQSDIAHDSLGTSKNLANASVSLDQLYRCDSSGHSPTSAEHVTSKPSHWYTSDDGDIVWDEDDTELEDTSDFGTPAEDRLWENLSSDLQLKEGAVTVPSLAAFDGTSLEERNVIEGDNDEDAPTRVVDAMSTVRELTDEEGESMEMSLSARKNRTLSNITSTDRSADASEALPLSDGLIERLNSSDAEPPETVNAVVGDMSGTPNKEKYRNSCAATEHSDLTTNGKSPLQTVEGLKHDKAPALAESSTFESQIPEGFEPVPEERPSLTRPQSPTPAVDLVGVNETQDNKQVNNQDAVNFNGVIDHTEKLMDCHSVHASSPDTESDSDSETSISESVSGSESGSTSTSSARSGTRSSSEKNTDTSDESSDDSSGLTSSGSSWTGESSVHSGETNRSRESNIATDIPS